MGACWGETGKTFAARTVFAFPSLLHPQSFPMWLFLPYLGSKCHFLQADDLQLSLTPPKREWASVSPAWSFHRAPDQQGLQDLAPGQKVLAFGWGHGKCWCWCWWASVPRASAASLQSLCIHFYQTRQQGIDLVRTLEAEDGEVLMFHCLHV